MFAKRGEMQNVDIPRLEPRREVTGGKFRTFNVHAFAGYGECVGFAPAERPAGGAHGRSPGRVQAATSRLLLIRPTPRRGASIKKHA